ncbi:hypothetical protein DFH09DRAFT_1339187 [Mycena vulgaris]|nr:hypothetical protein DFH09DRAFT_1339187 [Mycena vulgaris]
MFALRLASLFLLFTTFVSASPEPTAGLVVVRQATGNIETVLNTLKSSTDTIFPQITTLTGDVTADTDVDVTVLINDLTTALNTASSSLSSLGLRMLEFRDITNSLNELLGTTIPNLDGLLARVNTSLNQVLIGLENQLPGVLSLVANLLPNIADLTQQLGLTLPMLWL